MQLYWNKHLQTIYCKYRYVGVTLQIRSIFHKNFSLGVIQAPDLSWIMPKTYIFIKSHYPSGKKMADIFQDGHYFGCENSFFFQVKSECFDSLRNLNLRKIMGIIQSQWWSPGTVKFWGLVWETRCGKSTISALGMCDIAVDDALLDQVFQRDYFNFLQSNTVCTHNLRLHK